MSNPVASSQHDLVTLTGPGCFISALLNVRGGVADRETSVALLIDGKTVVGTTFAEARLLGLELGASSGHAPNFYGVKMLNPLLGVTVTVGFPVPILFNDSLVLRAQLAGNDTAG